MAISMELYVEEYGIPEPHGQTYPADDIIVVGKVCFAVLAAVNLVGV
jgi:hypothetical protein